MSESGVWAVVQPLHVRKVHTWRTVLWLARGWSDFLDAPLVGLLHGGVMGAWGGLLLWLAWDRFWVLAGALGAFLMVAPIASTALYAVSRARLRDESADLDLVWRVWSSLDARLVKFGVLLTGLGMGWVLTSAALITLGVHPRIGTPHDFLLRVVLAPKPALFEMWLCVGGLMAAPVFASSVVAIPLLLDRPVGVRQAVLTSWRAVLVNPVCMGVWAAMIMALGLIGLGTLMFGLVIVMPVLGHASWHAYRDLVVPQVS